MGIMVSRYKKVKEFLAEYGKQTFHSFVEAVDDFAISESDFDKGGKFEKFAEYSIDRFEREFAGHIKSIDVYYDSKPTIADMRSATGMTQTKFGEHLNIPMRTIQNWEGGVSVPPDYVLELIEYRLRTEELIK